MPRLDIGDHRRHRLAVSHVERRRLAANFLGDRRGPCTIAVDHHYLGRAGLGETPRQGRSDPIGAARDDDDLVFHVHILISLPAGVSPRRRIRRMNA